MDIGNLHIGSQPAGARETNQNASVEENRRSAETPKEAAQKVDAEDRVEISEAGQALAEEQVLANEVEAARRALENAGPAESRLEEIRQHVEEGHYSQPEVIREVARRIERDLG